MKRIYLVLLFFSIALSSFSQNTSSIDFTIRNLGLNVEGHFSKFSIISNFNTQNELIHLSGEIMVSSIDTGIESRDEHLLKPDYFNTKKHAIISLKSTEIIKQDSGNYLVKASLTIKGKTAKISIPVKAQKIDNTYKVTSNFEINRLDFNVGGSSFVMSKTVKINVIHYQNL
ncbi:YceI family protein [Winogradskyella immobilis]|uniref:YceI family protein n=1 Tax=Winogradskyella immobilis TaxID=2816852 RepID=A0ABS8EM84_9FLAO|nr:YceI family protein [Winogradskyella immobilis]MCC1483402.1 YceI family protein [Winogradskyella immobilis]MCG0015496.1 YceI family protein [Winogradskyella immobilis]